MSKTKIEWCDWTWNPAMGCMNKCEYCYARKIAYRMAKPFSKVFQVPVEVFQKFEMVWLESNFKKHFGKKDTHIFVNSMSDIMYWKKEWIRNVLLKCAEYPDKKFLFLTKSNVSESINYKRSNVYLGKSVNTQRDLFEKNLTSIDFLSIEPIQERIKLNMDWFGTFSCNLKQIIVGAETGNRKGKVVPKAEWIEEIREFCQINGIKYFEKDSLKEIVKRQLIQERI